MTQYAKQRYKVIGLGGTFDHFHDGHAFFLTYAAELGQKLLIGVTNDKLARAKTFPHTIQSFKIRAKQVATFCEEKNIIYELVKLNDIYGPTITRDSIVKAICVTRETEKGAVEINGIRQASNLRPLPVFVANMVLDQSGLELHADRIRAGQVNRHGTVYGLLFSDNFVLTEEHRQYLHQPLGEVIKSPTKPDFFKTKEQPPELPILVVGDASLAFFRQHQLAYTLGIYDGKQQRAHNQETELNQLKPDGTADNQAGTISKELAHQLKILLKKNSKPSHLFVNGEEDLATAALILLAPLHSLIYYGQPGTGIVEVLVTEKLKEKILTLFSS